MKVSLIAAAMVLMLASVGAVTADTKTDYDHHVNFANYHTYAWKNLPSEDPIVNNSLVQSRIRNAVNEKLSIRGFHEVKQNPDLYLVAHVSAQTVQDIDYYPSGWGWGYWGAPSDVFVYRYVEGTIIIDMVDAKINRLVWRAICSKTGSTLISVQKEKKIEKMVTEAFEHFPA